MHRAATTIAFSLALAGILGPAPAPLHAQPATDNRVVAGLEGGDRAEMQTMQIPSHGASMNALVYVAAGVGPHPAVVLLHGLPGYERNLDLAQDMRRAGWDVLYFDYRGSWGTPGDFSFSHGIEDAAAALAYLRQPGVAGKLRLDPGHIVLIGHSMGGFMAVEAAAGDPAIKAFATISAVDLGGRMQSLRTTQGEHEAIARAGAALAGAGMAPLAGCTPDGLARELLQHAAGWSFQARVDALKNRSVLVVTSDDGFAPEDNAFADALRKAGDARVSVAHLPTDHAYSDQRRELSKTVLAWLAGLPNHVDSTGSVAPPRGR
jgi:pimeloyl-ACP methyl ester carboxylesterase